MSHTKGPWRAGYQSESDRPTEMLVRAEEVDGQPWVAVCRSNFGDIPIEANARLIASAPCLLESWQEFLSAQQVINRAGYMDNYEDAAKARDRQAKAIEKARAAIAKATGEPKHPQAMGQCPSRDGKWLYREDSSMLWRAVRVDGDKCETGWIAPAEPMDSMGKGDVRNLSGQWRRPTDEEWERATSDHSWRLLD